MIHIRNDRDRSDGFFGFRLEQLNAIVEQFTHVDTTIAIDGE